MEEDKDMTKFWYHYGKIVGIIIFPIPFAWSVLTESDLPPVPTFEIPAKNCQGSPAPSPNMMCEILNRFDKFPKELQCMIDATHRKFICQNNIPSPNPIPQEIWTNLCIQATVGPFSHCAS